MTKIDSDTAGGADGSKADDCGVAQLGDAGLIVCIGRHRHYSALAEVYRRHGGPVPDLAVRVCGYVGGRHSGCVDGTMRGALETTGDFYNLKGAEWPSPLEHTQPDGPQRG